MATRCIEKPRDFPSVEELLQTPTLAKAIHTVPRPIAADVIRQVIAANKKSLRADGRPVTTASLHKRIRSELRAVARSEVTRVINAAGIVVHTNLGRAPLTSELFDAIKSTVTGYGNIEFNLATGKRGSRGVACEKYLANLAGTEAATVVNNNAAALLMILNTLANRKEVIVSRGELVQIGGGFRIPDILRRAGGKLCEVGSTNITKAADYEQAVSSRTGLILKVHQSNFKQTGFTEQTSVADLVTIGKRHGIPIVNDVGSGVFVPTRKLTGHAEPTVQQSVRSGADLTCFSGDKLLGGVQAGLIVGRAELVKRIKRNPLFRTVRVDKIIFSMLEKLLRIYLDGRHLEDIQLWRLLAVPESELYRTGKRILKDLGNPTGLSVQASHAFVGGGSMPEERIPSVAIAFSEEYKAATMMRRFRELDTPIIGRIEAERFLLDLRAVLPEDIDYLKRAIKGLIS